MVINWVTILYNVIRLLSLLDYDISMLKNGETSESQSP
jgi:hypothetical protein